MKEISIVLTNKQTNTLNSYFKQLKNQKMKKLILAIGILLSLSCTAQNVKIDSKGNYVAISHFKADSASAKLSGNTYTDYKGIVYPVYVSERGKMFVMKTSKANKRYNYYLKSENPKP